MQIYLHGICTAKGAAKLRLVRSLRSIDVFRRKQI
jgi:hypothetical protein